MSAAIYKNLSATNQVKVGAGKLKGIHVSTTSSGTLTIYDTPDADTNDPKIANTITVSAGTMYLALAEGIGFSKGLYVVLADTADFTVFYE